MEADRNGTSRALAAVIPFPNSASVPVANPRCRQPMSVVSMSLMQARVIVAAEERREATQEVARRRAEIAALEHQITLKQGALRHFEREAEGCHG